MVEHKYTLERIDDTSWKLFDGSRQVCVVKLDPDHKRIRAVGNALSPQLWKEVGRLVATSQRTRGTH